MGFVLVLLPLVYPSALHRNYLQRFNLFSVSDILLLPCNHYFHKLFFQNVSSPVQITNFNTFPVLDGILNTDY